MNRHKGTHTENLKHELHCTLTRFGPNETEMENIKSHYTIGQDSEMYLNGNANLGWLSRLRTNVTGDQQHLYLCPICDQYTCQHAMTYQALARHVGGCHPGVLGAAAMVGRREERGEGGGRVVRGLPSSFSFRSFPLVLFSLFFVLFVLSHSLRWQLDVPKGGRERGLGWPRG